MANDAEREWSRRMRAMLDALEKPVRIGGSGPPSAWFWIDESPAFPERGIIGEDGEVYLAKWRGAEDE